MDVRIYHGARIQGIQSSGESEIEMDYERSSMHEGYLLREFQ